MPGRRRDSSWGNEDGAMTLHGGQIRQNRGAHTTPPGKVAEGRAVSFRQGVRLGAAVHGVPWPARSRWRPLVPAVPRNHALAPRAGVCGRPARGGSVACRLADLLETVSPARHGRPGGGLSDFGPPASHHALRSESQEACAGSEAPQSRLQTARVTPPESALATTGCGSASGIPVGSLYIAREKLDSFLALPLQSVEGGCGLIAGALMELFWKAAGVFLVFGVVDLFRQMRRHKQDLRMSKQEIKEEMKEMEGNPQMKAKIRRLQRDRRPTSEPDP